MKQKYGDGLHLIILCASFHVTEFWWSKTEGKVESWGVGGGLSIPEQRLGSQGGILEFWILAHKQSWGFCGHDGYLQHPISPYDVCVKSNLPWAYHSDFSVWYDVCATPWVLRSSLHHTLPNFSHHQPFFFLSNQGPATYIPSLLYAWQVFLSFQKSPFRQTGKHASKRHKRYRYALPPQTVDSPDSKPVSISIRQELSLNDLRGEGGRQRVSLKPLIDDRHYPLKPGTFLLLKLVFSIAVWPILRNIQSLRFKQRAFKKKLTVSLP